MTTRPEPHTDSERLEDDNYDDILDSATPNATDGDRADADAVAKAQAEAADYRDKMLRLAAEMENLRKRTQRDVEDAGKYSVSSAAKPFLTVADTLARALDSLPADMPDAMKNFADGIRATQRELQNALDRMGVKAILPQTGDALNPHEHEVMFEAPSDKHASGTIVQVLEQGYKIHDRLLRPARVSVAKNTGAQNEKAVDISA